MSFYQHKKNYQIAFINENFIIYIEDFSKIFKVNPPAFDNNLNLIKFL